jgi:hypothetical protein
MKRYLIIGALLVSAVTHAFGEDVHVIYESAEAARLNADAELFEAQLTAQEREQYLGRSFYADKFKSNIHITDVQQYDEIVYCVQNTGQIYQTKVAQFEQGLANGSLREVQARYATTRNVDSGDVLKIRSGPGTRFSAVAGIPAGASDISTFEAEQVWDSDTWWVPVQWHGFRGYIGKSHLSENVQ